LRNGQGRALALSTHAARARRDKAAVGRLDFSRLICANTVMGNRMALAVLFGRSFVRRLVIPLCKGSLWIERCIYRAQRIWIESDQSAVGNACADRYATRIGDFFDRRADLAKDPDRKALDTAQSDLRFFAAYVGDVDQRPDRLRVSAAR